jgi:hypothetical protein
LKQPGMPPAGLQLSGLLSTTVEFRRVTFVFPVAIPPPADPWSCRTTVPMSVVVPRFAIAPPRPPDALCRNVLEMSREKCPAGLPGALDAVAPILGTGPARNL